MACSLALGAVLALPAAAAAQARYTAKQTGDIVQLRDNREDVTVSIMLPVGNAYEMVVKGHDVIRKSFATVDDFRAKPGLNGIPLLAPFANRLDEAAFYANGRKYNFDMELGNVRGPVPIHGYVSNATEWKLVESKADGSAAWVTSKLDFYRNPQYMQQFPFAHTITITYRLQDGALEVRTRLDNLSNEPMPVAIGFHPYFQLTDSTRDDWTVSLGVNTHWILDSRLIPTGETQPVTKLFPDPKNVRLKDVRLDDVFSDLERDAQGRAVMTLKGMQQQLDIVAGPKYRTMLVYSPPPGSGRGRGSQAAVAPSGQTPAAGQPSAPAPAAPSNRGSVAFEPMAGITNSMNMAQRGLYKELQSIAPGGSWEESFWVRPRGFAR
jgi:aldose 1-epimerase